MQDHPSNQSDTAIAEFHLIACLIERPALMDRVGAHLFAHSQSHAAYVTLANLHVSLPEWEPWQAQAEIGRANPGLSGPVAQWLTDLPTPDSWEYWDGICRERAIVRQTKLVAAQLGQSETVDELDFAGTIARLQAIEASHRRGNGDPNRSTASIVQDTLTILETRYGSDKLHAGLSTGLPRLDTCTDGLIPHALWVIASRPGKGKTTLALNLALHFAFTEQVPVAFITLEMPVTQIAEKLLFIRAGVSRTRFRHKIMDEKDFAKLSAASSEIAASKITIIDRTSDLDAIKIEARRLAKESRLKILIVDYLQLVAVHGERDRWAAISKVSTGLKSLASELGISVIALAQINRAVETENRSPTMADLRGSADIEADADVIGFLHHEPKPRLIVCKSRMAQPGDVQLFVDFDTGKIGELEIKPEP